MWHALHRMTLTALARAALFAAVAAGLGWLHETPRAGVVTAVLTSVVLGSATGVTEHADRIEGRWAEGLSALARAVSCATVAVIFLSLMGRRAPNVALVLAALVVGAMAAAPRSTSE